MSMFTKSDRAAVRPPGSGEKFPLMLNLKSGARLRGWFEPIAGRYKSFIEPRDIHDQVDSWEVIRTSDPRA